MNICGWDQPPTHSFGANMESLFIDEIQALLDIARSNGYEGTYDDFKNILLNDPEELRRIMPYQSAGPDFRSGGLVSLGYLL